MYLINNGINEILNIFESLAFDFICNLCDRLGKYKMQGFLFIYPT